MYCALVAYPRQPDAPFDFAYFATQHVPMFARHLGANCVRYEVHKPLEAPGAPAPQFGAVAYFWVRSGEEFGAALQRHSQEIYPDIANFTTIEPLRQWSEIVVAEDTL